MGPIAQKGSRKNLERADEEYKNSISTDREGKERKIRKKTFEDLSFLSL
jgi:hypothetical protein